MCCWTLRFRPDQYEQTVRKLKYWAAKGEEFLSRVAHKKLQKQVQGGEVPSEEQLAILKKDTRDQTDDEEVRARQGVDRVMNAQKRQGKGAMGCRQNCPAWPAC